MKENYFPITKDVWVICFYVSKTYSFLNISGVGRPDRMLCSTW